MATSSRYRYTGDGAESAGIPPYTRRARLEDIARVLALPAIRPRRRPSAETRAKLSAATFESRRAAALARPDVHPLKAARLNAGGGWTVARLAASAIVAPAVIAAAEAGEHVSANTWYRLSRALDLPVEAIRP